MPKHQLLELLMAMIKVFKLKLIKPSTGNTSMVVTSSARIVDKARSHSENLKNKTFVGFKVCYFSYYEDITEVFADKYWLNINAIFTPQAV